jgi:hypothetical protein
MIHIFKIIVVLTIILSVTSTFAEELDLDDHWYALLIDQKFHDSPREYNGKLTKAELHALTTGQREQPFFTLHKVFWLNGNGDVENLSHSRMGQSLRGYTDNTQFLYSNVIRISRLNSEIVKANFERVKPALTPTESNYKSSQKNAIYRHAFQTY